MFTFFPVTSCCVKNSMIGHPYHRHDKKVRRNTVRTSLATLKPSDFTILSEFQLSLCDHFEVLTQGCHLGVATLNQPLLHGLGSTDTIPMILCPEPIAIYVLVVPVWSLDLRTSGGMATIQLKIPAMPPAKMVLPMLSWLRSPPSGVNSRWMIS